MYRYDKTLFDELWSTPIVGDLPAELLRRLPEWCVYIEVGRDVPLLGPQPGEDRLHGVFVYLDHHLSVRQDELCMVLDYEHGLTSVGFTLCGSLEESIRSKEQEMNQARS